MTQPDRVADFMHGICDNICCVWQIKGPKNTGIKTMECWRADTSFFVFFVYTHGGFTVLSNVGDHSNELPTSTQFWKDLLKHERQRAIHEGRAA